MCDSRMAAFTIANLAISGNKPKCECPSVNTRSCGDRMGKENVSRQLDNVWGVGATSSATNLNMKQLKSEANKTIQNVKVTFDALSQKLRRSTRRRNRLENQSDTPKKELRISQRLTPVKMYSPFKIDTPSNSKASAGRLGGTPGRYTPRRRFQSFNSPSKTFRRDVEAVSRGSRQLSTIARGISSRNSTRT